MTTQFPQHAKMNDPNGYLIVQQMVEFLRDTFDQYIAKSTRGSSTITVGNTALVVNTGATLATYSVVASPLLDPGGRWWVSNKTTTSFQLNLQVAAPVGGIPFDWVVKGA